MRCSIHRIVFNKSQKSDRFTSWGVLGQEIGGRRSTYHHLLLQVLYRKAVDKKEKVVPPPGYNGL